MTFRDPIEHELRTIDPHWSAVASGLKPFDVRVNDRDFRVGDTLVLINAVTGDRLWRLVTYIVDGPPFLPAGLCVMGIK